MDFNELMIVAAEEGRVFAAVNENGENMLISYDYNGGDRYFRVETAQNNGWTRINYIFEDGTREEIFKKSNK